MKTKIIHTKTQKKIIAKLSECGYSQRFICGKIDVTESHYSSVILKKKAFSAKLERQLKEFIKNNLPQNQQLAA